MVSLSARETVCRNSYLHFPLVIEVEFSLITSLFSFQGYDITSTIVNQALVPRPSTHRMRRQAENENGIPDLEEVCSQRIRKF